MDKINLIIDKKWSDSSGQYCWYVYEGNNENLLTCFADAGLLKNWLVRMIEHYGDKITIKYKAIEIPLDIKEILGDELKEKSDQFKNILNLL